MFPILSMAVFPINRMYIYIPAPARRSYFVRIVRRRAAWRQPDTHISVMDLHLLFMEFPRDVPFRVPFRPSATDSSHLFLIFFGVESTYIQGTDGGKPDNVFAR